MGGAIEGVLGDPSLARALRRERAEKTTMKLFQGIALVIAGAALGCAPSMLNQADTGPEIPVSKSVKEFNLQGEYRLNGPSSSLPSEVRVIKLELGPDMAATCGLTRTHFDFDSAEPLPQDRVELSEIAACLNRPAQAPLSVELLGRADAKGRAAYNLELGRRRAERVRELLIAAGVAASRLTVSSRGAIDAPGAPGGLYEEGFDRRVDILLKGVVHAPR